MGTSKPQTGISYNTQPFLKSTLERLTDGGLVRHWAYIPHKGETSKKSTSVHDKDHIHLLVVLNKVTDLQKLEKEFSEVKIGEALPLATVGIRTCNSLEDWVLYVLHDETYLASKGEVREYHYTLEDFVTDNVANLQELYNSALHQCYESKRKITALIEMGGYEAIKSGLYSINQANNIKAFQNMGFHSKAPNVQVVDGRAVDTGTGEILDVSDKGRKNVSRETISIPSLSDKSKNKRPTKAVNSNDFEQTELNWNDIT